MSRKKKRAYLNDYHQNASGGYDYEGDLWSWEDPAGRKGSLTVSWVSLCLGLVLMIAAGCLPAPGADHVPYVLLPYAVGIMACVLAMMALMRLTGEKDKIRGHVYESSVVKLPLRLILGGVMPLVAALGELVYLALHRIMTGPAIGFIALECASGIVVVLLKIRFDRLKWVKE